MSVLIIKPNIYVGGVLRRNAKSFEKERSDFAYVTIRNDAQKEVMGDLEILDKTVVL